MATLWRKQETEWGNLGNSLEVLVFTPTVGWCPCLLLRSQSQVRRPSCLSK